MYRASACHVSPITPPLVAACGGVVCHGPRKAGG